MPNDSHDIVIVGAARTPVGSFNGAFANVPAHELGTAAIKAALERAEVEPAEVDEVILGQILTARAGPEPGPPGLDQGRHPAGQVPAWGLNQLCGSGLRAVALGYQQIANGDCQDRRRRRPGKHDAWPRTARYLRNGVKMGNFEMIDTMIKDGLWDAFNGYHMGNTAENVAAKWQITRERAGRVRASPRRTRPRRRRRPGKFKDEIAPVTIKSRKGDIVVDTDDISATRHHAGSARQAAPGLRQGRHRDRRQCLGHQ